LLLSASGTPGPDGDRLAHTTFVESPYTADYYFWKRSGA
jgi:hypothetical protein